MAKSVPEARGLLGDMAYESVRKAIRAGDMKPGERISEYKVAQWLKRKPHARPRGAAPA